MKSFFIIVNPQANHGLGQKTWEKIEPLLQSGNYMYQAVLCNHNIDFLVRSFLKKTDCQLEQTICLVIGGNGTLHDSLNALKKHSQRQLPLALIPAGKNNSFAKNMGISLNPSTAFKQIITTQQAINYDIGSYIETTHKTEGYFLSSYDIGLEAYFASLNAQENLFFNKLHLGLIGYLYNLLKTYMNQESFSVTLRINGQYEFFKKAYLVSVHTHQPCFDPRTHLQVPLGHANDGQLEFLVAEKMNIFKFLFLALMARMNKHVRLPSLKQFTSKRAHLIINSLEFGEIDGQEESNRYYDLNFEIDYYPFWFSSQS